MSADPVASRTERAFVTPEGVDLRLNIGDAGQRAGAFLLDAAIIIGVLIAFTIASAFAFSAGDAGLDVMEAPRRAAADTRPPSEAADRLDAPASGGRLA